MIVRDPVGRPAEEDHRAQKRPVLKGTGAVAVTARVSTKDHHKSAAFKGNVVGFRICRTVKEEP